ncbi:MAG: DUF4364 family protein [Christensenellales bacterium]|jgi:hypothetical protein
MSIFATGDERQRLTLLHLLDSVGISLTSEQIFSVFLEQDWGDYFSLSIALDDLSENGLLAANEKPAGMSYLITDKGRKTLNQFLNRLPHSHLDAIEKYAATHKQRFLSEHQNLASFRRIGNGEYMVTCRIIEGERTLLTVELNVVSADSARDIARRWVDAAPGLYSDIVRTLAK